MKTPGFVKAVCRVLLVFGCVVSLPLGGSSPAAADAVEYICRGVGSDCGDSAGDTGEAVAKHCMGNPAGICDNWTVCVTGWGHYCVSKP